MFALSTDVVKPGCHLRDLIRHRQERGSFVGDVDAYCARFLDPTGSLVQDAVTSTPDGRTIRLVFKRSPDGGWAATLEDVTEGRRDQARIEHLAHYDALTNLPNRSLFQRHAEGLLLETEGREFAILYIDIDEFKRINDTLGHLIGDEFLQGVAERLRQSSDLKISSPASAGMNSPSFSMASRALRTFTRWSRGSIRRCGPRSTATATSFPAMPASASRSPRATVRTCSIS